MIRLEPDGVDQLLLEAMYGRVHLHVVDGGFDRDSTYDAFVETFDLPEHFGHNLDALYDCLLDVASRHVGAWTLLWRPTPGGEQDRGLMGVLGDVGLESDGLTVAVSVPPGHARAGAS